MRPSRSAIGVRQRAVWVVSTGRHLATDLSLWAAFAVMGLFNNFVPFTLISWGQTEISGSLASILNATTPIWTVLLAHWLTADETLTGLRAFGVAVGFIGVAVMIGIEALSRVKTRSLH